MYGSMKGENVENMELLNNDSVVNLFQSDEEFLKNPFGDDKGNNHFWEKVTDTYGDGENNTSWDEALNGVRADEFIERAKLDKRDPLVFLIEVIHDEFKKKVNDPRLCTGFVQQLTKLGSIILQKDHDAAKAISKDTNPTYGVVMQDHPKKVTILHLLAERNLVDLAEFYLSKKLYPGHVHVKSQVKPRRFALEIALEKRHDEMASFLAQKMRKSRVRALFQSDEADEAKFHFSEIIQDPNMQETVVAVLDACVNPDWPYVPVKDGKEEETWSKLQDRPLQYHFNYRLLDGDQASEPAIVDNAQNDAFNHLEPSCLQLLIESKHSDVTISHPVIRLLIDRKWDLYGWKQVLQWFFMYMLFVVFLGLALFLDDTQKPRDYSTAKDKARGVFECLTILFTAVYLLEEFDQMAKEKCNYFRDHYNYFDLLGITLILVLIPLRLTDEVRAAYGVGAAAFLINCLRVFKFFPVFKDLGMYAKTFAAIIRKDILKFAKLFSVVMIGFTGCVFLAMKAATFPKQNMSFWQVLLKEVRAIAEGNPFEDDYDAFHVVVIILVMINMGAIIVILTNILIGQLSYRYEQAMEEAEIRYSIDKAKFITKIEKSRFKKCNLRMKHYVDGDYISNESRVLELLTDWDKLKSKRSSESKDALRALYQKVKTN